LLSKVTPAKPKIGDYAFTTTTINIGIAEVEYDRIQILDTPGTLNRVKLNTAELYAQLAMKYVADMIVLVYDASGQYTFEDQEELYRSVDKHGKNVYVFITKTDIPDKELLAQIKKTHKQSFSTYDEFLKVLRVEKRKSNKIE
jgi:GTP1/Obg family GTP-binding protein